VRAQCGYMLSHDSLVSDARRVLVCGGGILNSGMMQRVEYNVHGTLARDTKTALKRK
jgi:1,6-anhydro-N-acetylmuramate kinase